MPRTYEAILKGDRLTWIGEPPDRQKPTRVQVTILEQVAPARDRGRKMADALAHLARCDAFSEIEDPVAWQRSVRRERPLPGREA
ncbi:MAG: hypothetical protein D6746_06520 [Bacteroidetes bacterium]|nr:MAG: hypothetical protein D6746_06520 [Bacteroidota bacterium]